MVKDCEFMKTPSYDKALKKLLSGMKKPKGASIDKSDPVQVLVECVFEADATPKQASAAFVAIKNEFIDYNELRVAPAKDIVECVGRDHPDARRKAESLTQMLNAAFDRYYSLSFDYMAKTPFKDLRRHLTESGLSHYASAKLMLTMLDLPAIPVDSTLVETLELKGIIPSDTDIAEIQAALEKLVPAKKCLAAHELLREFVEANAKELAKKRKADAETAAKAAAQKLAQEQAAQKVLDQERQKQEFSRQKEALAQSAKAHAKAAGKAGKAGRPAGKAGAKAKAAAKK
jgi:endonuclease III